MSPISGRITAKLYNLSLYFAAKHMVLRSDRMVVGFTGYWHLLATFD